MGCCEGKPPALSESELVWQRLRPYGLPVQNPSQRFAKVRRCFSTKSRVTEVRTEEELEAEIKNAGQKLVLDFYYISTYPPCCEIDPFVDRLSNKFLDVVFVKFQMDSEAAIGINFPVFHLHYGGQEINSMSGTDKVRLKKMLADARASIKKKRKSQLP